MTSAAPLVEESESPTAPPDQRLPPRFKRYLPDLLGTIVVCIVLLIGFYQVPLNGRTFSVASYVSGPTACGSVTGACTQRANGDPRPDLGASAWQFEPWAVVTHRALAKGEAPLWNPYEALGTPLAADPPTAAFDPLMLGIFLHPTPFIADLSTLAWLLLIGLAAYWAARSIRLRPLPAVLVGCVYGLSGWFISYTNNWFFRAYVFLPLMIAAAEWTIRTRRRLPPILLGVSLAWSVVVGMPELTFLSVLVAGLYAATRIISGDRAGTRRQATLRLLGGGALGVAFAAPALLSFRQYIGLSFNTHPFNGQAPATDPFSQFLNWMMPKIGVATIVPPFDNRQWIGAAATLLAVVAIFHTRSMRRYNGWPLLVAAVVPGLQLYGGRLVSWTGHLPLWSQVGWTRFATPVIALPVVLLAGVGVQTMFDGALERKRVAGAASLLGVVVLLLILRNQHSLRLGRGSPIRGGWPLAAIVILAVIAAVCLSRGRAAAFAVVAIALLEVVLLTPQGIYAPRQPLFTESPWITFLRSSTQDHSRVFSTQGLLYPDVSAAYELADPRILDPLYPDRYWKFLTTFVSHGLVDRFTAVDRNESPPNIVANPMFDLLGVRYLAYYDSPGSGPPPGSESQFRLVFQEGGVKVFENLHAAPRAFVVHDIHAVPNMAGALQFILNGAGAYFPDGSAQVSSFDPRSSAVVEADSGAVPGQACANTADSAAITSYSGSHVTLTVNAVCPGLLVLTDQYFPGWTATVNGSTAKVLPTDVTMRGVLVPAGTSTVELRFRPTPVRHGLVLFAIGVIAVLWIAISAWRGSRRRAHPSDRMVMIADGAEARTDGSPVPPANRFDTEDG